MHCIKAAEEKSCKRRTAAGKIFIAAPKIYILFLYKLDEFCSQCISHYVPFHLIDVDFYLPIKIDFIAFNQC